MDPENLAREDLKREILPRDLRVNMDIHTTTAPENLASPREARAVLPKDPRVDTTITKCDIHLSLSPACFLHTVK